MKIPESDKKKEMIADRVRTILNQRGWTQQQLADAMDVHKSYISKVLAGQQNMTLEGITSIEKALGEQILFIK